MSRTKRERNRPRKKEALASEQALVANPEINAGVLSAGLLLISIGIVMNYSTTAALALEHHFPPLFISHLGALLLGGCAAYATYAMPISFWRRVALPLYVFSVLLLVGVEIAGVKVNGAQRWLAIPGLIRFQPVEICKFTTVIMVASLIAYRDGHEEVSLRRTVAAGALALPPIALLVMQPDLGNAVLLAAKGEDGHRPGEPSVRFHRPEEPGQDVPPQHSAAGALHDG